MIIDKTQISGVRFMFTIAFFLQASALLTSFLAAVTKHESWISIIFAIILGIPLIMLYRALMIMFPRKNLIQMLEEVYGKVLGKIIAVAYTWFFINLVGLNLTDLCSFAKIAVMTETPNMFLSVLCILVVVLAVRNGIRVVTRYSGVFVFIEFFIVLISIILLLSQIQIENLLPIFTFSPIKYIQSTHIFITIPFGELVVILMLNPNLKLSPKQFTKYWFWGVSMGISTVILVLLRDITILGNTLPLFTLPGFMSFGLVNLGGTFSHIEALFAITLAILLFFKITLHCYVCTICICQLLNINSFRHLAAVTGAFIIFYSFTIYPNPLIHAEFARTVEPFLWTLFDILIPLLTFVFAKIKFSTKLEKQIRKV